MASNVSREKLLFYSAAGGMGGFAAWGVQESFAGIRSYYLRDATTGLIIGLFICGFLASIEALSVSQWRQAMRGVKSGAIFGAIGGAAGLVGGEILFSILHGLVGRVLGWALLGVAVGLGVGWASGSGARKRNGALGGLLGGALGGLCYQTLTTTFPQFFGRAIAIIVLGMLIGFFIGLVGELLKRGWLMVIRSQSRNAREGREYPLTKPVTIIGRAEESDIGLFGDQSVLAHHAIIRREGRDFVVSPAGGGQILINRRPVSGRQALHSGDRVEVGGTLFIFRERAQAAQN
ncbi:MAG TPA: FHA domain-containing protein [Candidatus Binataceae bacterium]|nr:FHA domain-containing protein [Candidatus Binataceae bacterium]